MTRALGAAILPLAVVAFAAGAARESLLAREAPAPVHEATAGEAAAPAARIEQASAPLVSKLGEGARLGGVTRDPVRIVGEGVRHDEASVAVAPSGEVFVAAVRREGARERIVLARAPRPDAALGESVAVTDGARAWHPALGVGPGGEVWLAWCARRGSDGGKDHRRAVQLRRLHPEPTRPVELSKGVRGRLGRNCDPDLAVGADGRVHVVWESDGIAYRRVSADGVPEGPAESVAQGTLLRRPAIALAPAGVWVAWDALDIRARGTADPDYDVWARLREASGWQPPRPVATGEGIQAAPALAVDPDGRLLVAYHTSEDHGITKWWTVRRLTGESLEGPAAPDAARLEEPSGELQGAELPAVALLPDGRLVAVTRPSQGVWLHRLDGAGFSPVLDLTRRGWGARGRTVSLALAPDGSLLLARRARHDTVLERFTFAPAEAGPPDFVAVEPGEKRPASATVPGPRALPPPFSAARMHFGDVHMHSAVSDGTGPPDEILARAWARGLHFAALTDHDYVVGSRMALSEHAEIAWVTDVFDAFDDFVALHAFEWTTPPLPTGSGHRNVYYEGGPVMPLQGSKSGLDNGRKLHQALRGKRAITAPHHTAWTGTDWAAADPRVQTQFEIVSTHGAAERPGDEPIPSRGSMEGMFAVDGLAAGHRFGFLGGSDGHGLLWHHGIGRRRDSWQTGLTGALSVRTARAPIWEALRTRRTAATSGAPMVVVFTVGEVPFGGRGRTPPDPRVRWSVEVPGRLEWVEVVRDGEIIHRLEPGAVSAHQGELVDREAKPGEHSYYVRVQQRSDEGIDLAWASPAFVRVERKQR